MLKGETRLSDLRTDKDLKHKEIAEILKVKKNTYTQWEIGRNDIPILKLNELANFYNVSLDYLLGISNKNIKTKKNNIDFKLMCKRLKELRKEHSLTQTQLGNKVGFHQRTYSHYEDGSNTPTSFKLLYIAKYYNVSFDYLVGRSDTKEIEKNT